MSDAPLQEAAAPDGASQLQGIEQDLDTVDAALAALDSEDLEAAEALAAELEEPRTGVPGHEQRAGGGTAQ